MGRVGYLATRGCGFLRLVIWRCESKSLACLRGGRGNGIVLRWRLRILMSSLVKSRSNKRIKAAIEGARK